MAFLGRLRAPINETTTFILCSRCKAPGLWEFGSLCVCVRVCVRARAPALNFSCLQLPEDNLIDPQAALQPGSVSLQMRVISTNKQNGSSRRGSPASAASYSHESENGELSPDIQLHRHRPHPLPLPHPPPPKSARAHQQSWIPVQGSESGGMRACARARVRFLVVKAREHLSPRLSIHCHLFN